MSDDGLPMSKKDREMLLDYRAVFTSHAGARVLAHMERMAGVRFTVFREEMAGQPIDPVRLQINEGMKRLYWKIQGMLEAAEKLLQEGDS